MVCIKNLLGLEEFDLFEEVFGLFGNLIFELFYVNW